MKIKQVIDLSIGDIVVDNSPFRGSDYKVMPSPVVGYAALQSLSNKDAPLILLPFDSSPVLVRSCYVK